MRGGLRVSDEDLAVGRCLAAARNEAGLSQVEVARRLGFAQSRIAKLEIGTRRLLFSEAIALAEMYGVSLSAFVPDRLSGTEDGKPVRPLRPKAARPNASRQPIERSPV